MYVRKYVSWSLTRRILAQKAGLNDMPQEYLMFHLMENCLLSENDYHLVLTAIDMSKKITL